MSFSERIPFLELDPWFQEHIARYHKLTDYELGRCVLDIACGNGYGTRFISTLADKVLGVDQSDETIFENKKMFSKNDNLEFEAGDAENLALSNDLFDSVVSFETIEHLQHPEYFLSEVQRVLRLNGLFFLSTPNALITKPENGIPKNPFHIKEYTPDELHNLLSQYFEIKTMFGQTVAKQFKGNFFWNPKTNRFFNPKYYVWVVLHRMSKISPKRASSYSKFILKQPLYPEGKFWVFSTDNIEQAHDLFVVCMNKKV
jgi:2-polyprenyl-3-methyl-5-hydroxy-6-metoxy-1,4-benzoquinol methylase